MEQSIICNEALKGSFDRCLKCPFIGNGCSGPRTTAMTFERWLAWLRSLKELRRVQGWRVSNIDISEICGLSKNSVDNIFAGKQKDVSRTTAGLLEDYLIGGGAKWPCAMDLDDETEVVYQDRPETLDALDRGNAEIMELKKTLSDIHAAYRQEMDIIRDEAQRKIDYLANENKQKSRIIDKLLG